MRIEYIGDKPRKVDNVADSGVVWNGKGDIQEVPDGIVGKLLIHKDVWATPEAAQTNVLKPAAGHVEQPVVSTPVVAITLAPGAKIGESKAQSITLADGTVKVLEGLDKAALHALAKEVGVTVHPASGAPKVTEALLAAFPVKG